MNELEHFTSGHAIGVDVGAIERDLAALWRQAATGTTAVMRACSWNLIVLVEKGQSFERAKKLADALVERVPSRMLVLDCNASIDPSADHPIRAYVSANCKLMPGGGKLLCSEEITIEAGEEGYEFLPSLTRALLVPDIPIAVLSPGVPSDSRFLTELVRISDRLIIDSRAGELHDATGARMVDLAWMRGSGWRQSIARAFDDAPEKLKALSTVTLQAPAEWKAEMSLVAGWLKLKLGRQLEVTMATGATFEATLGDVKLKWDSTSVSDDQLLEESLRARAVDVTFQRLLEAMPMQQVAPAEGRGAFVQKFVEKARRAIEERGVFTCALTGGSAVKLYPLLAKEDLDWSRIEFFVGDERLVPLEHADSNYRAVREALPQARIHPVRTELSPDEAAADYARLLPDELDLIHLGMGPDGHVCSLFPGHPLLKERARKVAAILDSPKPPPQRVTFTRPVLENARELWFLITGDEKKRALAEEARTDPRASTPAAIVNRGARRSTWFFDL